MSEEIKKLIYQYCRIDYEDDKELIELIYQTVIEQLKKNIIGFSEESMTATQKIIMLTSVKNLYDNREKYEKNQELLSTAASSMILSEYLTQYEDNIDV